MPSASPMSVSVTPHRSSSRYQSALLRASRETSSAEHDAHLAQCHLRGHVSEAGALGEARSRDAEVLVDDLDLVALPAQRVGAFDQSVLTRGGLAIVVTWEAVDWRT